MQTAMFKLADIYLTISARRQCMHSPCAATVIAADLHRRDWQPVQLEQVEKSVETITMRLAARPNS